MTVVKVETTTSWSERLRGMDRRVLAAVVVVLVLAGSGTWWFLQRDNLPEGAAFQLGDEVVMADDVDRRIDALEALYGVQAPEKKSEKSDFLRDAAKSMAVQLMLQDEAKERGIVIAAKEIDDTLQTLIEQRYPDGGRTAFVAALGELGASEDQVRDEIGDQLLVSRLFDDVAGDVSIDEAELEAAFEDRKDELATPVRRNLRNIVVADRPSAEKVLRRLRAGESFTAVAKATSLDSSTRDKGGDLGALPADNLEDAYAKAAFTAPVGALFGPVQTESGWNVGRVDKELPAAPAKFAELREALRRTVLAEKSLKEWRTWLKDVIADHDVTYADAYLPDDPGAVPDIDQADVTEGK
ncbi:peptidyl-prolyl cis-trans isomerase [Nocardioides sp. WS12]|uniref:peptidyl-prolyl cis-trans isomerase n=1 Tax=Nocardioides sp. WS12 TaxID=2486272 RepID=UPI0015F81444|nr:peptidyl-prolyl cis-trans isomerase [Nocardioides sp. WS12]